MKIVSLNSTIEVFRKRYYPESLIRVYTLSDDGESLDLAREITRGFFMGEADDLVTGQYRIVLTLDRLYTDGLTQDEVLNYWGFDLLTILGLDEFDVPVIKQERFAFDTNRPPRAEGSRTIAQVVAMFNDEKPVNIV